MDFYLIQGRTDSKKIQYSKWKEEIIPRIGSDFFLCDDNFSKFLEFDKVGVIRKGKK